MRGSHKKGLKSSDQTLDWIAREMCIASTTIFVQFVDKETAGIVLMPMCVVSDGVGFIAGHFDQAA